MDKVCGKSLSKSTLRGQTKNGIFDQSGTASLIRLAPLSHSSLTEERLDVSVCRQRSQVSCVGDALSKFEYRFPGGDRQRSKEKVSRDSFFVHE